MKDFRIGDLGGAKGVNNINGKNTKVQGAKTNKTNFDFAASVRKLSHAQGVSVTNNSSTIADLNLPPHMKNALANVANAQTGISDKKPLTNPNGENLTVSNKDYIPDDFKEKAYTEV